MLSGVSRDRPAIVGWSTAPRGQVIEVSFGQLPKKLAAGPRVLARTELLRPQSGTKQGGPPHDYWAKFRTTSVHSKPICLCSDCTFLDEIHRAGLEKKAIARVLCRPTSPTPRPSPWSRTISTSTVRLHSTKPFLPAEASRLVERFEWHYTPKHGSWLDLAEVRTRHPIVPMLRPPHTRQTNPHRRNCRLGARPQCQPHQGQLALHDAQCTHQTQASTPFDLTESDD